MNNQQFNKQDFLMKFSLIIWYIDFDYFKLPYVLNWIHYSTVKFRSTMLHKF